MTERQQALWRAIEPLIADQDLAHDRLHLDRVYRWAVKLAPEVNVDPDLAGAAALVHDLVNVPKDSADRARAGELSAEQAAPWLLQAGYSEAEAAAVVQAVARSSWSRGQPPVAPLDAVLQDADRLDAIGACGIMRVFSTAQSMRGPRRYYHSEDPMGSSGRQLDDKQYAVDHFRIKLLRLAGGMHLPAARVEAGRRQQLMQAFLDELLLELANPEGAGDEPGEA